MYENMKEQHSKFNESNKKSISSNIDKMTSTRCTDQENPVSRSQSGPLVKDKSSNTFFVRSNYAQPKFSNLTNIFPDPDAVNSFVPQKNLKGWKNDFGLKINNNFISNLHNKQKSDQIRSSNPFFAKNHQNPIKNTPQQHYRLNNELIHVNGDNYSNSVCDIEQYVMQNCKPEVNHLRPKSGSKIKSLTKNRFQFSQDKWNLDYKNKQKSSTERNGVPQYKINLKKNNDEKQKWYELNYHNYVYHVDDFEKPGGFNTNGFLESKPTKLKTQSFFKDDNKPKIQKDSYVVLPSSFNQINDESRQQDASEVNESNPIRLMPKGNFNHKIIGQSKQIFDKICNPRPGRKKEISDNRIDIKNNTNLLAKHIMNSSKTFTPKNKWLRKTCLRSKNPDQKQEQFNYFTRFGIDSSISSQNSNDQSSNKSFNNKSSRCNEVLSSDAKENSISSGQNFYTKSRKSSQISENKNLNQKNTYLAMSVDSKEERDTVDIQNINRVATRGSSFFRDKNLSLHNRSKSNRIAYSSEIEDQINFENYANVNIQNSSSSDIRNSISSDIRNSISSNIQDSIKEKKALKLQFNSDLNYENTDRKLKERSMSDFIKKINMPENTTSNHTEDCPFLTPKVDNNTISSVSLNSPRFDDVLSLSIMKSARKHSLLKTMEEKIEMLAGYNYSIRNQDNLDINGKSESEYQATGKSESALKNLLNFVQNQTENSQIASNFNNDINIENSLNILSDKFIKINSSATESMMNKSQNKSFRTNSKKSSLFQKKSKNLKDSSTFADIQSEINTLLIQQESRTLQDLTQKARKSGFQSISNSSMLHDQNSHTHQKETIKTPRKKLSTLTIIQENEVNITLNNMLQLINKSDICKTNKRKSENLREKDLFKSTNEFASDAQIGYNSKMKEYHEAEILRQLMIKLVHDKKPQWKSYKVHINKSELTHEISKIKDEQTIIPLVYDEVYIGGKKGSIFGLIVAHGMHKIEVLEVVKKTIDEYIKTYLDKRKIPFNIEDLTQSLRSMIMQCKSVLLKKKFLESFDSGASVCMVILIDNKIITLNIGGQQAMVISEGDSLNLPIKKSSSIKKISPVFENKFKSQNINKTDLLYNELCNRHDPFNMNELDRINMNGGQIKMQQDQYGDSLGNMRIFKKDDLTKSYLYTRSIGDFDANGIAVLNEPEIFVRDITNIDLYILISVNYFWQKTSAKKQNPLLKDIIYKMNDTLICNTLMNQFNREQQTRLQSKMKNKKDFEIEDFGIIAIRLFENDTEICKKD